jgi:adenine-specific DNA-methyltransferase
MDLNVISPRRALNKAYLKLKPTRTEIEVFKTELIKLIDQSNDTESEEFHKNLVSDFLKKTYYKEDHFINTKDTKDLVIHEGKAASSPVNVIIEAKKPTNKSEMITADNINAKAFQETILYFLRERILDDNKNIKYLIITNIYEWFIFDATLFEKLFVENKKFAKEFKDFSDGKLSGTKTDFFYKKIAKPYIDSIQTKVEFVHFDIRKYDKLLRNDEKNDDNKLIALYKLISPQHLLKLSFANDSNTLDKKFYAELLHLIGLTEKKKSGKKVIERLPGGQRNSASLLENTIIQLDSEDEISNLINRKQYGEELDDQLFSVGLELVISWVNRILFLKLLESQLISYHKGDKEYSFLNKAKIKNFDDLNRLFFQVLAKKSEDRNEDVKSDFSKVPYLNSSLFEPTELERKTLKISNLIDNKSLPVISTTVLKKDDGRKLTGELNTIEYLFDFLDAYDFASDTGEDIQEENKSLINASVLGLIYEKINGYKDGSFFTPGFVTMYMCREAIQQAVISKFNDSCKWKCKTLTDVYNKIDDAEKANEIFNSIKVCDPAVGSGHFLVSALNELIFIKHELGILKDENGKRIKNLNIDVVNDELIISDEDGELFEYKSESKESQRIQKSLFNEKKTIIENCLFGVDINPNSVKICRLRLWIELLKNTYYKSPGVLETLPNIDINIKCGNSLISRFDYAVDLKKAFKKSKIKISDYKSAVSNYKNAKSKEEKRDLEELINQIKSNFKTEINSNDPKIQRLNKSKGELNYIESQRALFEETTAEKKKK